MNEVTIKFIISHIRKAIYNLECAEKLAQQDLFEHDLLKELKLTLLEFQIKLRGVKDDE